MTFFQSKCAALFPLVFLIFPTVAAHAQLKIDERITESKTLEMDYYGNYSYSKNAGAEDSSHNWDNELNFNRSIEKEHSGNWQKINFDFNLAKRSGDTSSTRDWDTDFGSKKYILNSPFFFYSSLIASQNQVSSEQDDDKGVNTRIVGGTGAGRVVDLANFIRARKVQNALIKEGVIDGEFSREIMTEVIAVLRQKKETLRRVVELNRLLTSRNVLNVDQFDIDTTFLLSEIIEESTDRLESGFEGRFGYGRDLSTQIDDAEKYSYFTGMLKFAKPLSEQVEFSERVDYYESFAGDNQSTSELISLAKITYDLTKTKIIVSYEFRMNTYEYDIQTWFENRTEKNTVKNHMIEARYNYEVVNKINLSLLFRMNKEDSDYSDL